MTEVSFGGGLWLVSQIALLVLYYGNVYPSLPWWVVWFPTLLLGVVIVIALVIFIIALVIF
jgi:hypothetical protein